MSFCLPGEVGCHLDRHENIGQGRIGIDGFKNIMADSRLNNIPMILETPPKDYAHEIRLLYSLVKWLHQVPSANEPLNKTTNPLAEKQVNQPYQITNPYSQPTSDNVHTMDLKRKNSIH